MSNNNKNPLGLIAPPLITSFLATENWPKVKLRQIGVGSNNAEITDVEIISGHYYIQFI